VKNHHSLLGFISLLLLIDHVRSFCKKSFPFRMCQARVPPEAALTPVPTLMDHRP
jgi:hypothetical protein